MRLVLGLNQQFQQPTLPHAMPPTAPTCTDLPDPVRAALRDRPDRRLTILTGARSGRGRPVALAKTYRRGEGGAVVGVRPPAAYLFDWTCRAPGGLEDLARILTALERQPRCAVVRAAPRAGLDRAGVRRLGGHRPNATFRDAGLSWLCVDVDDLRRPRTLPPGHLEGAALYAIAHLPDAFCGAGVVAQWSGSAGVKGWDVLKLHLWFWLSEPVACKRLRPWADKLKAGGAPIDPALYRIPQLHLTAAPILDGLPDPVEQRTVHIPGPAVDVEALELPWPRLTRSERRAREAAVYGSGGGSTATGMRFSTQARTPRLVSERGRKLELLDTAASKLAGAGEGDRYPALKEGMHSVWCLREGGDLHDADFQRVFEDAGVRAGWSASEAAGEVARMIRWCKSTWGDA